MTPSVIAFSLVTLLLLLSGFFSGSETAYTSLSPIQIKNLGARGARGKKIAYLTSHPEELISTILVINNILNILASTLTTIATINLFGKAWVSLATGILVLLLLILGEISPKQLALTYNEVVVWHSADILYWLLPIFKPFISLVTAFSNFLSGLFKGKKSETVSLEALLHMTSMAENLGILQREEKNVFQSLLRSGNTSVASILVHRKDIVSFEVTQDMREVYQIMLQQNYDAFPIWRDNVENIIGILRLQELMRKISEGKKPEELKLKDLYEEPIFIPASKKIKELFKIFNRSHTDLLIALDEFGGLAGILTKDNLLREILGELYDQEEKPEVNIQKKTAKLFEIKGETPIYDFEEFFDLQLQSNAKTLGGYLLEQIDRIPQANEIIDTAEGRFVAKEIIHNRISLVSFMPQNTPNSE